MSIRSALLGAAASALALGTTTALAGSGVGGVFNLGQTNSVDGQTILSGNPGANAQLRLVNGGTGAAVRAESQSGIGVNGTSVSGTGQFGQSQTGIGLLGIHADVAGTNPGVEGRTNSVDPNGAGVVARNTGGGPGLKAVVDAGAPPLAVNSPVKVANLNSDLLDGLDSNALQQRVDGSCASGQAVRAVDADGSVSCEPVGITGAWGLNGNGGTAAGSFIGTTDAKPLVFKANNAEALRLSENGNVGIGTTSPVAKLDVNAGTSNDPVGVGIFGRIESLGFGGLSAAVEGENVATGNIGMGVAGLHRGSGWGVYGESASGYGVYGKGKFGLVGTSSASDGSAVWASNSGAGNGIYGQTSSTVGDSAGVRGVGGTCGFCVGVYGSVPGNGIGVRGETPANVNNAWGVQGIGSNDGIGVRGTAGSTGTGVYGRAGNGGSFSSTVSNGTGVVGSVSGAGHGVRGEAGAGGYGVFGKNTSSGVGVVGASPSGIGVYGESQSGLAGKFAGKVEVQGNVDVAGYLKLRVFSSWEEAPLSDCDEPSEVGRMAVVNSTYKYLLICFGSWYVWRVNS